MNNVINYFLHFYRCSGSIMPLNDGYYVKSYQVNTKTLRKSVNKNIH